MYKALEAPERLSNVPPFAIADPPNIPIPVGWEDYWVAKMINFCKKNSTPVLSEVL